MGIGLAEEVLERVDVTIVFVELEYKVVEGLVAIVSNLVDVEEGVPVKATLAEVLLEEVLQTAQTVPREVGSLKLSAKLPLVTPYFVPAAEEIVELPL